jgi:hypothetical protein
MKTPEYSTKLGTDVRLGARLRYQTRSGFGFTTELLYGSEQQSNSILQLDRQALEIRMIFALPQLD